MSPPPALFSDPQPRRLPLAPLAVPGVLLLAAALGMLGYHLAQPRWYQAQAVLDTPSVTSSTCGNAPGTDFEAGTVKRLEALRTPAVLDRVVSVLDLTAVYGREGAPVTGAEARERLDHSLRLEARAGDPRTLALIGVCDRDPALAARIANKVADAYLQRAEADYQSGRARNLAFLSSAINQLRPAVARSAESMQQIRERGQVTDPDPEQAGSTVTGLDTAAYLAEKKGYLKARSALAGFETELSGSPPTSGFEPARLLENASPPADPLPWWLGDPRGRKPIRIVPLRR